MASISTRRLLQRSTAAVRASLSRTGKTQSPPSVSSGTSNVGGLAPSNPAPSTRLSRPRRPFSSPRLPVELGCGDSLMPLHSATASALLNSMLSSKVGQWGCLSEVMETMESCTIIHLIYNGT
ncbi:hypothetical protein RHMOL_Rhmol10G0031300 [Rhododendron molle]|uniref:Uncharacterized protein n=1 Tax=Rhododendron molle TaxID=49168 RepID=A0ACC0LZW5_RHOML|nr:hypothetical protein RHMOL_Rhmol10G0031300 [Rhododendron molle]